MRTALKLLIMLAALSIAIPSCKVTNESLKSSCECEFMSIAALAQLLKGQTLPAKELAELLKTAITIPVVEKNGERYPMVDPKTYIVLDRTVLSKYIFTYLGWQDVWLEFGESNNKVNLVGYLGLYRRNDGSIHYALYNTEKQSIWMYHQEDAGKVKMKFIPVYITSKQ